MKRETVVSSNIRSIGYDQNTNILEVEFRSGRVYQYMHVPIEKYQGIMAAESHGKYLNRLIKNKYPCREV